MVKHCSSLVNDDEKLQNLHSLCQNRLRDFGITVTRSRSKSLMIFPSMTYSRKKSICALTSNNAKSWSSVFGKPLEELPPDALLVESEIIKVPQFLISILNYLRKNIETEGLFRKDGSQFRMKALKHEIEELETFVIENRDEEASEEETTLDAGSLLKCWLRELPEPLIPARFHQPLLECCKISNEHEKIRAILTVCLMLPGINIATLTCLMKFLAEVAKKSHLNKMEPRNLAIIFAPNVLPVPMQENIKTKNAKKISDAINDISKNLFEIVEIMIRHAHLIGIIDQDLEESLARMSVKSVLKDSILLSASIATKAKLTPSSKLNGSSAKFYRQLSQSTPNLFGDEDDDDVEDFHRNAIAESSRTFQ